MIDGAFTETSDWKNLMADPSLERARKLLSFEELRAIMKHARDYERGQLEGTLSYLRRQARLGHLHPQVVIQNVDKAIGKGAES